MSKPILVIYASRFGHSHDIAQYVEGVLGERGQASTLVNVADLPKGAGAEGFLRGFAAVVLVGSVQYGYIDKRARRWVKTNLAALEGMTTLLITVSLTARKYVEQPPADISEHVYTAKFLEKTGWTPTVIELAAGRLEYPRYNFFDRKMIQLIMRISGGVTDGTSTIEYTNWDRLGSVAADFAAQL